MLTNKKITIRNEYQRFITLWLEPWGEDYGMLPEELFEVRAVDAEATFYFHLDCNEKSVTVWAEGDAKHVAVYKDEEMLSCGHNRRENE